MRKACKLIELVIGRTFEDTAVSLGYVVPKNIKNMFGTVKGKEFELLIVDKTTRSGTSIENAKDAFKLLENNDPETVSMVLPHESTDEYVSDMIIES